MPACFRGQIDAKRHRRAIGIAGVMRDYAKAKVKELGLHDVHVLLHPEVDVTIYLNVARSEEEAELQASGKSIQELAAEEEAAVDSSEPTELVVSTWGFNQDLIDKNLNMPSGVAYRDGALYVADVNQILRYDDIEDRLEDPPEPVVVSDALPTETHHGWKYLRFAPDGSLFLGTDKGVYRSLDAFWWFVSGQHIV